MAASYTPREQQYYNQLFDTIDKEKLGLLTGEASFNFLLASKLPQSTLGEVWDLSDPNNTGYLTKDGWWKACRLIGWAQKGETVREELVSKPGPFPTFEGYPPPPTAASTPGSAFMTPQTTGTPVASGQGPKLTPEQRTQFTRIFVGCQPEGGLVSGTKAQAIFLKSNLPYDKLAQIWNLADTQQRGSLDLTDFIIGMYYIQALMSNQITALPATLPPGVYESASGGRPRPPVAPISPIPRQTTGGGSPAPGASGPLRQMSTSAGIPAAAMLQPQATGQSLSGSQTQGTPTRQFSTPPTSATPSGGAGTFGSAFPANTSFGNFAPKQPTPSQSQDSSWDVTPQEKTTADGFFDGLDPARRGFIEGDVAVPFMLQSGLDEDTLAQVWDLADIRREGKLTREEFAVAMHLINAKLAGKPLPSSLPTSAIPPALRSQFASQSGSNQPTRDLLDVFGDSPPATAIPSQQPPFFASPPSQARSPPPAPIQPQGTGASASKGQTPKPAPSVGDAFGMAPFVPAGASTRQGTANLMADDEDHSSSVPDHSADLGNTKNALESTTRSVASLQTEKETLERTAKTSSAELHELEMRLSSVRAQHETETRLVNDLKTRTAEQKEKLNTLRDDLIRNESELSALRAEKDEIEQTLLQEKEEVRNLGKRMKEVTEETNTLKALLEKMKKEARQQKGMVAISKKQVSTLESGRDSVQKDLDHLASTSHDETAEDLTSPFEERARSPEVPALVAAAAAIPLPSTPQRTLSPDSTGMSQKSNNPFDRLKREAPSLPSSPPTQARSPESEHEGMSSVPKAVLGMGGAIAASALSAAAGVVDAGASAVSAITGKTHEAEPAQDDKSITPEPESSAENITEQPTTAEPDEADPFGVPAMSPDLQQASAPTSPGFDDQEDPFGMSSFGGVAAATKASEPAAGHDKVDTGFGDSFGESFGASQPGTQPVAAANGADTDFDEAFRDFDNPAEAAPPPPPADEDALPNIPHPTVHERSLSTQALPPTSEVHTPISEMPSTEVSTPRVPDEKPVPVEVDALKPHPLTESATASPVAADLGDESSDDEDEGPENLDRARTPFNNSTEGDQVDSAAAPAPDVQQAERNFPDIQTLGLGPTVQPAVEGISQPVEDSRSKEGGEITPFPPAAVPVSPASPVAVTRREPPPPPTGGSKSPPSSQQPAQQPPSTNPFTMFSPGPPVTSEAAQTDKTQEPATNAFDDDDFDFENLPSVQVASGSAPAVPGTVSAPTGNTSRDFDAEFDDFSPDFEMVEPPPPQATVPAPQAQAQALHAAAFGSAQPSGQTSSTNTSGFDDEDWGNLPSATSVHAGQAAATNQGTQGTAGAFSFDDAFGSDFSVPPFNANANPAPPPTSTTTTTQYAPPPGPPPRMTTPPAPTRPDLPTRPSISTRAQADDLEDVKKLCGMGFDRDLVISALEANDYNLQKTLNVLLPGQ